MPGPSAAMAGPAQGRGWALSLEGSLTCTEQLRVLGLSCQASSRLHSDIPECSFHISAQKAPSLSMPGGMGRTVTGAVCRQSTPVRISLIPGQSSKSDSCTPRRHEGSLPGVSERRTRGQLWGQWGRGHSIALNGSSLDPLIRGSATLPRPAGSGTGFRKLQQNWN